MSVKDFEERMVRLPQFGRKKKSASGMHQDVENPEKPEEEEEQREDEGTDQEDADEEEEEGDEEEEGGEEEDPDKFCNRECYVFNVKLEAGLDDKCCKHCKLYLTLQCPHISEFMDEVEEGDVD